MAIAFVRDSVRLGRHHRAPDPPRHVQLADSTRLCAKKPLRQRPGCTVQQRAYHRREGALRPKVRSGAREAKGGLRCGRVLLPRRRPVCSRWRGRGLECRQLLAWRGILDNITRKSHLLDLPDGENQT